MIEQRIKNYLSNIWVRGHHNISIAIVMWLQKQKNLTPITPFPAYKGLYNIYTYIGTLLSTCTRTCVYYVFYYIIQYIHEYYHSLIYPTLWNMLPSSHTSLSHVFKWCPYGTYISKSERAIVCKFFCIKCISPFGLTTKYHVVLFYLVMTSHSTDPTQE